MTDTFSFQWEGTDNPNDPSGVALLTVGSESVSIQFNNFSQAGKLQRLIKKACDRSKEQTIHKALFKISNSLKDYLYD